MDATNERNNALISYNAAGNSDGKVGYCFVNTRLQHADTSAFIEGQTQKELFDVFDRLVAVFDVFVEKISQACRDGSEENGMKIECREVDAGLGRDWIEGLVGVLSKCLKEFAYSPLEPRATEVLLAAEAQFAIVVRSFESGVMSPRNAVEFADSFSRTLGESLEILRRHGSRLKTKPTAQIYYANFEDDTPSFRNLHYGVGT